MIAWEKAVTFVHRKGNNLEKLRLQCALEEPYARAEAEDILAAYQFFDGSWDYNPPEKIRDRVGSLGGTIHCLRWLREFEVGDSPKMIRTLQFLSALQGTDGSFYETDAKLTHSPQKWLQKETIIDRFYFTAAVLMRLSSLGYGNHPVVRPAVHWLEQHWSDWELVTGTWYNVWALLCSPHVMNQHLYDRCYAKTLKWIPHLNAQPLTWVLDAAEGAHFSPDERLIVEGIARLRTLQNREGFWPDPHAPVETTVTALRLLHLYG